MAELRAHEQLLVGHEAKLEMQFRPAGRNASA
jgi:hypothetical protein